MSDFRRYIARTEAWARVIEDDTEEVVGSTGRVTAYRGDFEVKQNMRGQMFNYVMTEDDFLEDWVLAEDKNTDSGTSDTGSEELAEVVPADTPQAEEIPVDIVTVGTPRETVVTEPERTPVDDTVPEEETVPVEAPLEPVEAPPGSAASEVTQEDVPAPPEDVAQPEPTTPSQSVAPSQEASITDTEAVSTNADDGGDSGFTPTEAVVTTPSEPAPEPSTDTTEKAKTLPGKRTETTP